MQKITQPNPFFIIVLGILGMLPPLAIDMYLPSFWDIARDLNVSEEKVQHTLALFTFGFALGQIFWGPIADSFGRKPIILIGVVGAATTAFFLTQVNDIYTFYWLRLIQGILGAAPAVVLGALIRDLFNRDHFAKMMSMIMIVAMIAPLVAPIIGGYLAKWFHWHSIFYLLMFIGILCALLVITQIPETLMKEKRIPLQFTRVLHNFANVLSRKEVIGYILCSSLSFAGMFCFLTSGSLVYIGIYGVASEHFGYFFLLNIVVMMIMTAINGRLVTKIGSEKMLQIGLGLQLIAGIWLVLSATFQLGLWSMAIGIASYIGMVSTIGSNANAAILDLYPQMAGTANAVTGTARFGIGSVIGSSLSYFAITNEKPMLYAMGLCILCGFFAYYFLARKPLQ